LSRRNHFRHVVRGELPDMAFISAIDNLQSRSMVKDRQVKSKSLSERLSRSWCPRVLTRQALAPTEVSETLWRCHSQAALSKASSLAWKWPEKKFTSKLPLKSLASALGRDIVKCTWKQAQYCGCQVCREGMQGGKAKGKYVVLDLTVTDLHQVCTENCNSQIRHQACPAFSRAKYYAERHAPQWIHNNPSFQELLWVSARASHGAPVAPFSHSCGAGGEPCQGPKRLPKKQGHQKFSTSALTVTCMISERNRQASATLFTRCTISTFNPYFLHNPI